MKIMIDIVFNHTSHDSVYASKHPEWFLRYAEYKYTQQRRDETGKPKAKVASWNDIVDLQFENQPDLWTELINVLKYWAQFGVDGFRCDVACLVPLQFWIQAHAEVEKVKPGMIWLAESSRPGTVVTARRHGYSSVNHIYNLFNLTPSRTNFRLNKLQM